MERGEGRPKGAKWKHLGKRLQKAFSMRHAPEMVQLRHEVEAIHMDVKNYYNKSSDDVLRMVLD